MVPVHYLGGKPTRWLDYDEPFLSRVIPKRYPRVPHVGATCRAYWVVISYFLKNNCKHNSDIFAIIIILYEINIVAIE